jgi:hypothetical protein
MEEQIDFAAIGASLADAILKELPGWVERCVLRFVLEPDPDELMRAAKDAVEQVESPLRELLAADIDRQRGTPLTIVRTAVSFPTSVIAAHGVSPVPRDPFAEQSFPLDVYDLTPGSWADIGDSVPDPGLRWSVAKAYLHSARHR